MFLLTTDGAVALAPVIVLLVGSLIYVFQTLLFARIVKLPRPWRTTLGATGLALATGLFLFAGQVFGFCAVVPPNPRTDFC